MDKSLGAEDSKGELAAQVQAVQDKDKDFESKQVLL